MTFDERLTWLLIGMVIGGVLGYFAHALRDIRSTVHHLDDQANHRDESGLVRKPLVLDMTLLIVVILVAYAAIQSQAATNAFKEQDQKRLVSTCQSGTENRNVQRTTVDAIYSLALSFTVRDPKDPPLTDDEIRRTNNYIDRVNDFRANLYKKIKPSKLCEPYVKDDDVKPPTPPAPPIKRSPRG